MSNPTATENTEFTMSEMATIQRKARSLEIGLQMSPAEALAASFEHYRMLKAKSNSAEEQEGLAEYERQQARYARYEKGTY